MTTGNNIYKSLYFKLFNACEDALNALNHGLLNPEGDMKQVSCAVSSGLMAKLNECEEIFIEFSENS